jgi:hypothetical protein
VVVAVRAGLQAAGVRPGQRDAVVELHAREVDGELLMHA